MQTVHVKRRSALGLVVALIASLAFWIVPAAGPARAQDGTILRTISAQVPACSVSTGIAFDGSRLLVSCDYTGTVYAVSPTDGSLLATYPIAGLSAIGAMAWDRGRSQLWACDGFGTDYDRVWLIDLATGTATYKFTSYGCVDGLAYDGSDDTIWGSPDVASYVYHYKTDGTLLSQSYVYGKLGSCGNSGLAVGGGSLFLANDGCSQIYRADKDLSSATLFGTYPARLEDMECDDITFGGSGQAAIWSKDAYDNVLNAFELNPGDCGYGGYPSSLVLTPADGKAPVGEYHVVTARLTDPTTGQPLSGKPVSFSVTDGPNTGAVGNCLHLFPSVFDTSCNTDLSGEVGFGYQGTGGVGHDTVQATAQVPSTSSVLLTQQVQATVGTDWTDPARYVALGDSYSAGEGLSPYGFPPPGQTKANRCHRSQTQAYSEQFKPSFYTDSIFQDSQSGDVHTTFQFLACSGATTRNVRFDGIKQYNEPDTQLNQLFPTGLDKNVLTMTIGGNDAGFADILEDCALHACLADSYKLIDGQPLSVWLPEKIDSLYDTLYQTYTQIRLTVDLHHTSVYILGYPQVFPAGSDEQGCFKLTPWDGEMNFLRDMGSRLNGVIQRAAADAGLQYVSVPNFAGHEVCGNGGEWINGPTFAGFHIGVGPGSFHPNATGQKGYAAELTDFIDNGLAAGIPALPNGLTDNPVDPPATTTPSTLGTLGQVAIDPVPGSPGPCASDAYVYSPSQQLQLSAPEFAAGSTVSLTFSTGDSDPVISLGTATADSSGNVSTTVTLPAGAVVGDNAEIVLTGSDVQSGNRVALQMFSVDTPQSGCDATPPAITITTPADGAVYTVGQSVAANYSCDDGPTGSGVAVCAGPVASGSLLDTSSVGSHGFTVTATDNAGNSTSVTHMYQVQYGFSGFQPPISSLPTVNVVNAGQTVPVKWTLADSAGAGITDTGAVVSVASVAVSCQAGTPQDSVEPSSSTAGLRYLGDGAWIFNWATQKSWAGTCRNLIVTLKDGTTQVAAFRFR